MINSSNSQIIFCFYPERTTISLVSSIELFKGPWKPAEYLFCKFRYITAPIEIFRKLLALLGSHRTNRSTWNQKLLWFRIISFRLFLLPWFDVNTDWWKRWSWCLLWLHIFDKNHVQESKACVYVLVRVLSNRCFADHIWYKIFKWKENKLVW